MPRKPKTEKITTMSDGLFIDNSVIDIKIVLMLLDNLYSRPVHNVNLARGNDLFAGI